MAGGELKAQVASAQSQGVQLSDGAVQLGEDNMLRLSGQLHSDVASLLRFLKAMPEAGELPLDELSAEGVVDGSLAAAVPLEHPEGLSLDINVVPSLEVVRYQPMPVSLRQVEGEVSWQQSGEQRALLGNLQGRWQGGGSAPTLMKISSGCGSVVRWIARRSGRWRACRTQHKRCCAGARPGKAW